MVLSSRDYCPYIEYKDAFCEFVCYTFTTSDKGKLFEKIGRKTKGPYSHELAASYRRVI